VTINQEQIIGISNEKFINSTTFSGASKDILDTLIKREGLEWNIQDGELFVMPTAQQKNEVAVISKDSGLLGMPIRREKGIEFESLLNPLIKPNVTVRIKSKVGTARDIDELFVVKRAVYVGDTREGDWLVKCQAIEPEK
jgi:hypothetical protein